MRDPGQISINGVPFNRPLLEFSNRGPDLQQALISRTHSKRRHVLQLVHPQRVVVRSAERRVLSGALIGALVGVVINTSIICYQIKMSTNLDAQAEIGLSGSGSAPSPA